MDTIQSCLHSPVSPYLSNSVHEPHFPEHRPVIESLQQRTQNTQREATDLPHALPHQCSNNNSQLELALLATPLCNRLYW